MSKVLSQEFFQRPTEKVAIDLLGKVLVRRIGRKQIAVKITELEIYDGFEDRASHAFRDKTKRNKIMFEEGGRFYIYLCYGMHWMINIVVGKKDYPSAILIRGGEIVSNLKADISTSPAGKQNLKTNLNGPGKLSGFLKIDKKLNERKAIPKNKLWFEDRGFKIPKNRTQRTPRIGIHYAGPIWSKKKWRFVVK